VLTNKAGFIWNNEVLIDFLPKPTLEQKNRMVKLIKNDFMKGNYREQYYKILE